MKNFKSIFCTLILFVSILNGKVFAASNSITPPDSTTNLVDKSAALIMIEDGKKMFSERKNREALILFREAAQKDPNTWRAPYWISLCHYNLDNYGFALQYATKAVKLDADGVDKDVYDVIAKSYHSTGKLDSAIMFYEIALEKLSKMQAKDLQIKEKIENCKFAQAEMAKTPFATKVKMVGEVNSGYNEYAPIIVKGGKGMFFASRRNNTTGGLMNPEDEQYFEDIYYAQWNEEEQKWDSITNEIDRINASGFEAMSWISKDGLTAYMTINNEAADEKIQTQSSDIFEIQFTTKGKWSNPKKIVAVNSSFFDGAATVTGDGNTMYFVSTRNGERKQFDIYVAQKTGKTWGEPKPVSDSINTTGSETTPYITADGRYLFFSSNGHLGMGGYDIFVSENLGSTWSKPINLGSGINTVNNDTHFQYYPELKKAVFAGFTIQGQKASLDLYQIDMTNFVMPKK
jgi:tetratricopeptide (TPR) repeat protein